MESWLTQITNYLLAQSWQIAVLAIIIAIASFLLRNRSAHIRYILWLVVLAKCLVPPLYTIPLAVLPHQEQPAYTPASPIAESISFDYRMPEAAVTEFSESLPDRSEKMSPPMTIEKKVSFNASELSAMGWIAGVIVLSLYYIINALRTQIWLHKRRRTLPSGYQKNIESLFVTHGVKRMPRIWLLERISQPFVWGLVRGSIYLPAEMVDKNNVKFHASLLGHELSHVTRFDALINSLQVIIQAIFWFHPFVWWANRKIRAEREKCCDEMTIARSNALPEEYSEAIVEILAAKYKQARAIPSLAVAGHVKNIEERIKTMLKPGKKFYKRPSVIAIIVLLFVAAFTIPIGCELTNRSENETATEQEGIRYETLFEAAQAGDLSEVQRLIDKGADVNAKDKLGGTPLHDAVANGKKEVAELLIEKGADVNSRHNFGGTPLHLAVEGGYKEIVELLIIKGANTDAKNHAGQSPINFAMRGGYTEIIELLREHETKEDISVGEDGVSNLLYKAVETGDIEQVKLLISQGADVNAKSDMGATALNAAVYSNQKEIVEILIENGADVNAKGGSTLSTALHDAAIFDLKDIAELLIENGADVNAKHSAGGTPLHFASGAGSKDVVEVLLNESADIDVKNVMNQTPLMNAVSGGHKEIVEMLISKGADINVINRLGITSLDLAQERGNEEIIELLIENGAEPSEAGIASRGGVRLGMRRGVSTTIPETEPANSLHEAATAGDIEKVRLLISQGADVNAKDNMGGTALIAAVQSGQKEVVEFLIEKGADVNTRLNGGGTPLHGAVGGAHLMGFEGPIEIVELLIDNGAELNTQTNLGMTPLHIATRVFRKDIIELLITKGADLNIRNIDGRTALEMAELSGFTEIVELLRKHGAKE